LLVAHDAECNAPQLAGVPRENLFLRVGMSIACCSSADSSCTAGAAILLLEIGALATNDFGRCAVRARTVARSGLLRRTGRSLDETTCCASIIASPVLTASINSSPSSIPSRLVLLARPVSALPATR
jgi:hypothetical protein